MLSRMRLRSLVSLRCFSVLTLTTIALVPCMTHCPIVTSTATSAMRIRTMSRSIILTLILHFSAIRIGLVNRAGIRDELTPAMNTINMVMRISMSNADIMRPCSVLSSASGIIRSVIGYRISISAQNSSIMKISSCSRGSSNRAITIASIATAILGRIRITISASMRIMLDTRIGIGIGTGIGIGIRSRSRLRIRISIRSRSQSRSRISIRISIRMNIGTSIRTSTSNRTRLVLVVVFVLVLVFILVSVLE